MPPMDCIGSKGNSSSNKIDRKTIQDVAREIPIYPYPVYQPHLSQKNYQYTKFQENCQILTQN